jgi:hypothetical protein
MGNLVIEIKSAKIVSQAGGVPTWEVAYNIGGTPAAATVIAEDELTARQLAADRLRRTGGHE